MCWSAVKKLLNLSVYQLNTSLHYETTDTGLVYHVVCLFTLLLYLALTDTYYTYRWSDGHAGLKWVAS